MEKKLFIFLGLIFLKTLSFAQISENFSDGDFYQNPVWTGHISDFIVNTDLQLQSNNTTANSSFYLSTPNELAVATQWEFWVKIAFNPSSANYIDAYLTASAADLTLNTNYGYFVRIGNTDDEISLYRKDANGNVLKIIDGINGILNSSNNRMKIKVTRDDGNKWALLRDLSGTGNNYISEGSVVDATHLTSSYFGFLIKQSTASFFQKHFFDDIEIKDFVADVTPPFVRSVDVISNTQIDVLFNEPVDKASAELVLNYYIAGLGMPRTARLNAANAALLHLEFENRFTNGNAYTLELNEVADLSGNQIKNQSFEFKFYSPQQYDVLINEIFADPNPQVGLPLHKFLELINVSPAPINLKGWKLLDGNSTAILPSYKLQPDSFLTVCSASALSSYEIYGSAVAVTNFPAMNIGGATIVLKSADDQTIHAVKYDLSSYKNELKKSGGWSLEMIDAKNPCTGAANWKASVDASGGTPGRKNSVAGSNKDESAPKLLRAFTIDDRTISLIFDEPLDSTKSAAAANYVVDKGIVVKSVFVVYPFFNKVNITFANPLQAGAIYTVTANNISDCAGNHIGAKNSARFGLAQDADTFNLVINEILFNPRPNGSDYVELYNRSDKIIDLKKIYLANRNSAGVISNIHQASEESVLLFPASFALLTADVDAVKSNYITTNPDAFLQMSSLPSYPNTGGHVIVLNHQGSIIDEVAYSEKWHFPLIKNAEGVALERIDYNGPSVQTNFHSASTSVGYGTPGYQNSQYKLMEEVSGNIHVTPPIFSPDNDGIDDFVTISYSFPTAGYVTNITIFDGSGRPVRSLQKNSLSGIKGYYQWDGLNDKKQKLSQGIYIIYTEIFNTEGKKKYFKNTVVLARRAGS